jgi:hypothetical protein
VVRNHQGGWSEVMRFDAGSALTIISTGLSSAVVPRNSNVCPDHDATGSRSLSAAARVNAGYPMPVLNH